MSEMIAPCMASILAASRLSLAASRLTSSLSTATLPSKVDTKPWISLRVASRSFSRETNCSLLKVRGYKQNNAALFQSQSVELEVEAKGGVYYIPYTYYLCFSLCEHLLPAGHPRLALADVTLDEAQRALLALHGEIGDRPDLEPWDPGAGGGGEASIPEAILSSTFKNLLFWYDPGLDYS